MDHTAPKPETRLLVVDDDDVDRRTIRRVLGRNYVVLEASTGAHAESLLRSGSVDCVLLDYHIPGTDTLAFLETCAQAQIPVIMLTGVGNEALAVEALKRGAQDYLTKDQMTQDTLEHTVAHVIKHAMVQRRLEDKQRELEDFVATAAHDLKSPLRTIVTQCQLVHLLAEDALAVEAREALAAAITSGTQLADLVEALLAYTRVGREAVPNEPVDLQNVVEEVVTNLETFIHEAQAVVEVQPLPTLCGDRTALYQLMLNLLSNALKFRSENPPHLRVTSSRHGAQWQIMVTDNGIGINPEFHRQIFEPLTRLHSRSVYEGSGLGLALCTKIVHQHKGQLSVESYPGSGSTFTVVLPVAP
jgi:light-regulated signal transduction histidine kinase (bacteriophytochrome)